MHSATLQGRLSCDYFCEELFCIELCFDCKLNTFIYSSLVILQGFFLL